METEALALQTALATLASSSLHRVLLVCRDVRATVAAVRSHKGFVSGTAEYIISEEGKACLLF